MTFADDDSPDPNDPFGYLAEDARYLVEGPLPEETDDA